jgi:ribonuclease Y
MEIIYALVGAAVGGLIAFLFMRSKVELEQSKRETERSKADAEMQRKIDERVETLRDETVEKTRKRVERELKEELAEEVREGLEAKYAEEVREGLEATAREDIRRLEAEAEAKRESMLKDAELKATELGLAAKREAEEELKERRQALEKADERLSKREELLDTRAAKLDEREVEVKATAAGLDARAATLSEKEVAVATREGEVLAELERVARLSVEEAKREVVDRAAGEAKIEAARTVRAIEEEAMDEADRRAKKILSVAVQRYAGEYAVERAVNVVQLPSDDLKGRIIGREGRNIRALEAATGVDVIIDDTPEAVIVSGFDPVRRQIARLTLEKLISDGRIHPSRIEEVVAKTETEVAKQIKEAGERAAFELGIHKLHPELSKIVGRLRYRTSYGQNMWSHSIEVGFLCGLMASELGVNVKLARRAGLLHDIGKALTHEQEGSHALIGAELCARYGETEVVRNAVAAHHNEEPQNSVIAHLVIAADALSGARPGARREILSTYIKRLEDLERISMSFEGVEKTYAIQAGREIRVMVQNSKVDDDQAFVLSREIARRIEDELTYPGQIRVTVIRETRAVEIAR